MASAANTPIDNSRAVERDDRKTAHLVGGALKPFPGSRVSKSFDFSREILRSPNMRQAGGSADSVKVDNPDHISFFFLDGEVHKRRRASVAAYFTPKAILTRYNPLMERMMDEMIADFRTKGSATLDLLALELAGAVTLEILGLTASDRTMTVKLLKKLMDSSDSFDKRPLHRFINDKILGPYHKARFAYLMKKLYTDCIVPAIEARKREPRNDVVTYMLKNEYSVKAMIIEVMTYAGAGVSTTREFMQVAAWQLFDHPELKERFLTEDENGQFKIIQELLRLDPVAGYLYRRTNEEVQSKVAGRLPKDQLLAIDIRASNQDASSVGENPYAIDPDRAEKQNQLPTWTSFGDGPHRCPGAQVAVHETRIFLNRLFRVPGLKLEKTPDIGWSMATQGYEMRNMIVSCTRA
ncbi:Cytochrome P450 [Novosphingobium sp. CF614]|uniref:cytochrome P450 n=1 Tax=Novosphingobium sp. CF614 TaxID=1884364 RepID=UPI0008DFE180|nr:cytochrome P450 [Novosphingobium sp. CF614]SFG00883.1 Cytochrome P450 [Novosphingobium sp. CF614]